MHFYEIHSFLLVGSFESIVYFKENVKNYISRDIFIFQIHSLYGCIRPLGYHLLQSHGCLHKFKIPPNTLETMLGHLEWGYARYLS